MPLAKMKHKDALITELQAQLKACKDASSQKAEKGATEFPTSDLKDELVRMKMRIKDLERSNKILRDKNTEKIAKFSEAAKARKAAVSSLKWLQDAFDAEVLTVEESIRVMLERASGLDAGNKAEIVN